MAWTWTYEAADGSPVEAEGVPEQEPFPSQADAESWVGETWRELHAAGVSGVSLFEGDRKVYGPMALEVPG
jgi:hypothetical protein